MLMVKVARGLFWGVFRMFEGIEKPYAVVGLFWVVKRVFIFGGQKYLLLSRHNDYLNN